MQPFSCVLPSKAPWRLPVEKFLPSRPWWIILLQSVSWYCNFSQAHQLTKEKPTGDSTSINKHLLSTKVAGIFETRFSPSLETSPRQAFGFDYTAHHPGNHSRPFVFEPTYAGNINQYCLTWNLHTVWSVLRYTSEERHHSLWFHFLGHKLSSDVCQCRRRTQRVDCELPTDLDPPETLWPQRKFLSHERQSTGNRLHCQFHHLWTVNIQLKIFQSAIIASRIAKRQNGNILLYIGSSIAKEGYANHIKE